MNKAAKMNSQVFDSKLATKCQDVASCLTYNDRTIEGDAKHTLLEASHRLDHHAVLVKNKEDGLLLINARGKSRLMTYRERIARWLLRGALEIRP